jgi:hypothetical protein
MSRILDLDFHYSPLICKKKIVKLRLKFISVKQFGSQQYQKILLTAQGKSLRHCDGISLQRHGTNTSQHPAITHRTSCQ